MARLAPLPIDAVPELKEIFARQKATRGLVPNALLIMQRRPKIVKALRQLMLAVFDPNGEVSVGFKRLLAYVSSKAHGCQY